MYGEEPFDSGTALQYFVPVSKASMISSIDISLFFLINHGTANPLLDLLMPLVSDRGFLLALPPLILACIAAARRQDRERHRVYFAALIVLVTPVTSFFLADLVNNLLKVMIARPRPCHVFEAVRLLTACPRSFSLPSGHAIASVAFAVSFSIVSRNLISSGWRWCVLTLAGIIAFSRVYIGVHYPSDVLLGTALGIGLGWGLSVPVVRMTDRFSGRKISPDAP